MHRDMKGKIVHRQYNRIDMGTIINVIIIIIISAITIIIIILVHLHLPIIKRGLYSLKHLLIDALVMVEHT